jgi:hypothetical protein
MEMESHRPVPVNSFQLKLMIRKQREIKRRSGIITSRASNPASFCRDYSCKNHFPLLFEIVASMIVEEDSLLPLALKSG